MKKNRLGQSDLLVSEIGFGCMSLPLEQVTIARGPLAKGLLSSKPAAAFQDYSQEEVANVQKGLESFTKPQRSKGQVAIRFALSHPAVAVSIPGSSRIEQLEENVGSSTITLTDNELEHLQNLSKANKYELHR